jgi:hypothetical protein
MEENSIGRIIMTQREIDILGEKPQCHFVDQKFHMDVRELNTGLRDEKPANIPLSYDTPCYWPKKEKVIGGWRKLNDKICGILHVKLCCGNQFREDGMSRACNTQSHLIPLRLSIFKAHNYEL